MINPGFIGLGAMGQPMALNLRKAGHALWVYSRNPQRAQPLVEAGATFAAPPLAVAQAAGLRAGNVVVDMGIVLAEAQQANLALPTAALAGQILNSRVAAGAGELDPAALATLLERLAGMDT